MENGGQPYSYDFQLQREDLIRDPRLKDGIPCLSLLLDLNKEEVKVVEDIELHYKKDSQGRVRWEAAAILAIKITMKNKKNFMRELARWLFPVVTS